jgi:cytochrome bd-type quinol oxidase subunit 2
MQNDLDKRYKTMLTLWFGIAMSIGSLFALTLFAAPEPPSEPARRSSTVVLFAFAAVGALVVVLSFAVKRKLLQRSVEQQDVMLVQPAMVVACAMCEVSALLGVMERFVIGSGEHFLLFLIAAVGIALHFPRRDELLAATWKDQQGRAAL